MVEREKPYNGDYRLIDLLGRGEFGEVYSGKNIDSGMQVVIKLLYIPVMRDDEVAIFQQNARILARLKHPNIVRVLDYYVEDDSRRPALVMDFAPNGTLRERHTRGTRLPLSTVVKYVRQIAAALQYGYDQGIIHLDVKPENILIGQNDELLLSDFGITRLSEGENILEYANSYATGAPDYTAPEQIEGKPCAASDQYALAIMVYEWLCGRPPFSENDERNIQRQHMDAPVPSLREQIALSPAIERVVLRALAKKSEERFGSVRKFAAELESEAARAISRRNMLVGVGGGLGLVLLGAVAWWEIKRASSPPASKPVGPQGTLYLTYRGHSSYANTVAWSPGGKRIASGSFDGTAQVWDATTGSNICVYRGHGQSVTAVAWSPDSKRIASASTDQTVQVWDAANGGSVFIYHGYSMAVNTVAWSPDGKHIVSGGDDGAAQVWEAASGVNVFTYHRQSGAVQSVAWSPDGKRIASGSFDGTVHVWDATTGGNAFVYRGHDYYVFGVAWSPDSTRIASASADETLQMWDAANGRNALICRGNWQKLPKSQEVPTSGPKHAMFSVAWSPDGKRIATGNEDRTVLVWDATNGDNVFIYRRHSNEVYGVAWSPDSQRIASACGDGTVQVWQA